MVGFCAKVSMLFGRSRDWAVPTEVPRTKASDQNKHGDPSDAKAMYNGCTRDVQRMPKGTTGSQHRSNPGATPGQHARIALVLRLCRAGVTGRTRDSLQTVCTFYPVTAEAPVVECARPRAQHYRKGTGM